MRQSAAEIYIVGDRLIYTLHRQTERHWLTFDSLTIKISLRVHRHTTLSVWLRGYTSVIHSKGEKEKAEIEKKRRIYFIYVLYTGFVRETKKMQVCFLLNTTV